MKINRLLSPDEGANGGGTVTTVTAPTVTAPATPTPAPATTTPTPKAEPITNPGEMAKVARQERLEREANEIFGKEPEITTPKVEEVKPGTTPAATPTTPAPALTPQTVAEIAAVTAARFQPKPVEKPAMTQDEIDQALGVVKVTPEMCQALGLPAEAAPQLQEFAKAVSTNAVRMANIIVQQAKQELLNLVQPHINFAQQQQQLLLEHEFNQANPDLKGYEPVIKDVAARLKASGFKGTRKEAFDKIANGTREYLKTLGVDPAARQNGNVEAGATTVLSPKPNMSTVSKGSQGGAGGAPKPSQKDDWRDVFAKE